MKLFVGLGNPEKEYFKNRHNVGFMFLDTFNTFETFNINKHVYSLVAKDIVHDILLAKPNTFMNASGKAVKALVEYFKVPLSDLYVVHDDLDIHLGEYKIQKGVGPKIHNGVNSVEDSLQTKDFWRIRIGVDNRVSENRISGDKYVLSNFEAFELDKLSPVFEALKLELLK